jgi:predicted benzoate:H+ symporter BenE
VAEAIVYFLTLALFSVVIVGTARMRHEMLLLACIPPVFVAAILGFIMTLYAADTFGSAPTAAALALGVPPGWWLARRFQSKHLLIAIYLTWSVALAMALAAFSFPDHA